MSTFPFQMKENCTIVQQGTVTTAELQQQLVPRLQPVQLACKENVGQPLPPSHPMTRSRRQQQVCALQCTEMEVIGDCINTVGVDNPSSLAHGGHPGGTATAPMDYTSSGSVTYGSLSLPPTTLISKQPGFNDFQTNSGGIQMLQGGSSLHSNSQHPLVLGFGMGMFTPLPNLQWTQSADLWRRMRAKDVTRVAPETELRLQHPGILPSMRVILFDWMMEVGVCVSV